VAQEEQKIVLVGKQDKINKSKLKKEKTKAQEPSKTPQEIQREVKAKQEKDSKQKAKEAKNIVEGMSPEQKENHCNDIFHDIKVLTNGKGTVNKPSDYIENGKSLLIDDENSPLGYIKRPIKERIDHLHGDKISGNNLYDTKREGKNSWTGHQDVVNRQKKALKRALKKYKDDDCGDRQLSPKDAAILAKARKDVKLPTPNEPDPLPIKNSNTRNSTNLPRKVKDAPLMGFKFGSRTIDKIQRVVDRGWDYFNSEQGRKQLMEILKLLPPVVAVKVIIEIGKYVFPVLMPQDRVQEPTKEDRPIVTTDNKNPTSLTANPTGMALQFTNNLTTTPVKVNEAENIASNPTTTLIFDTLKYLNGESPPPVNTVAAKVADNPINPTTTSIEQANQILASLLVSNNPPTASTPQLQANIPNSGIQMSR
jgi:hypothetical protein